MSTLDRVRKVIASNLGLREHDIEPDTYLGMICKDSLEAVSLNQDFEDEFGKDFDHWFVQVKDIVAYADS